MIFLISSILVSTLIFVIFRVFSTLKIDTFQAIVYNYFTAFIFGFAIYGNELNQKALENLNWIPMMIVCGLLFIGLFLVLGLSSQRNGLALTSVALKMSMGISLLLVLFWNNESINISKISGIILAILGVLLMSIDPKNTKPENKPVLWMLFALFLGGGILDFSLNFAQNNVLQNLPSSLFCAFGFALAGLIGLSILIISFVNGKRKFAWRNVLAGIGLGIPNFFSIYLLLQSYEQMTWSDSTILAVTNISIVILSAIVGLSLFKERLNLQKSIGLIVSISAILVLYYATI